MGSWLKTQMKQRLKAIFKGPVVFHPLLLAAFLIIALCDRNMTELQLSGSIVPWGLALVFCGTVFVRVAAPR